MAVQRVTRWCVLGGSGMLGNELQDALDRAGELLVWAPTRSVFNLARPDLSALQDFDVVVNCAGLTDVDAAETNEDEYMTINGYAPNVIGRACRSWGAKFVQVSSDHAAYPVGVYGRSKLQGEADASLVVRTAWLYSRYGRNFAKSLLGSRVPVVCGPEQRGHPTWARDVAEWIVGNARVRGGAVDVVSAGLATRAQFARAVLFEADRSGDTLVTGRAPSVGHEAPRPLRAELAGVLPYWRDRLAAAHVGAWSLIAA